MGKNKCCVPCEAKLLNSYCARQRGLSWHWYLSTVNYDVVRSRLILSLIIICFKKKWDTDWNQQVVTKSKYEMMSPLMDENSLKQFEQLFPLSCNIC